MTTLFQRFSMKLQSPTEIATALATAALQIGAIKLQPENPFTWASGFRMPIYNDNRLLLSSFATRKLVTDGFAQKIAELKEHGKNVQLIAGTATAGIPWATSLADRLELPMVYVREKPKTHGKQKRVEGIMKSGSCTVLIEDLISTGGSSINAIQGVREEGGSCDHCLAIFTYGFPESEAAFAGISAHYHPLLKFSQLLEIACELKQISDAQVSLLQSWSSEPFQWGERNGFPRIEMNK